MRAKVGFLQRIICANSYAGHAKLTWATLWLKKTCHATGDDVQIVSSCRPSCRPSCQAEIRVSNAVLVASCLFFRPGCRTKSRTPTTNGHASRSGLARRHFDLHYIRIFRILPQRRWMDIISMASKGQQTAVSNRGGNFELSARTETILNCVACRSTWPTAARTAHNPSDIGVHHKQGIEILDDVRRSHFSFVALGMRFLGRQRASSTRRK